MTQQDPLRATFASYGGAIVAVFLAWLVRYSLGQNLADHSLYVTFVGAILITTWLSGLGAGLFALVLSVLTILYAFLPPIHSFLVKSPVQAVGLSLFVVVVAICIGVTEALRAMHEARAAALRMSDERFRHLTEAVPSMVWTAAPDGSITYANEAWFEFGGAPREPSQQCLPELVVHPDDRERCLEQWKRSLREGTEYEAEVRHRRKDGVFRWFVTRAVPWKNAEGAVISWFGITTDIHEQKEMQERLHEADRRKDEFLATLAHELRNPLAPLRNALEVMRRASEQGQSTDPPRAIMERQLTNMVRLVDDLMDLSRITRGRIELRLERIDLATALNDAVETCRPQIAERHHRLSVELPREPLYVDGDRVRLAQVFTNLISNATKYSPPGGDIRVCAVREGGKATVRVRDSGIGIPPEILPQIFDMFSQAVRSQELTAGGLGIGLSLVRGLVEQHSGVVEARSDGLGKGSEFVVRLPLAEPAPVPQQSERRGSAPPAVRRRVLVADDNRDAADSLATMLALMGHEARVAYDGPEALEAALSYRPDVIVLDLGMPRMDGYEAARRIRNESWSNGVLLVALTGWGQEEDRARAKRAGFDHHLTKPASPEALVHLLSGDSAPSS
ncbi:MAG TPA: ATP-binding protein [Candidatus Polarisedimenticolia bacterium]|nr:ATP-binding protein [Candidatus Polarisedimenticolia bacterium]